MEKKILVAYASKHGATAEIAEAVAETIRERGLIVDVREIKEVNSLDEYTGVIMGIALYMFHMMKDATRFLKRHQKTLNSGMPVALFASGPTDMSEGKEDEWASARKQVDDDLAKIPWFKPLTIEIMGGKFDPNTLKFPFNLIPAMKMMPVNDLRDWDAIRAWAGEMAEKMG
ncbi:MAG: flavodoxin domain-containing protein [Anaerolineaceae bacterium]|nr:flavodoxin domain-containing protein [Anaerolineaceae bacterium]